MAQFFRLTDDMDVSVLPLYSEEGDTRSYRPIQTSGAAREWDFELPVNTAVKISLRYTRRGKSVPLCFWWQPLAQKDEPADLPGDGSWNNKFSLAFNEPFLLAERLCLQHSQDIDILRLKSETNDVILTMKFHVAGYKAPKAGDARLKPNLPGQEDHSDWVESEKKGLHALLRQLHNNM